MLKIGDIVKRDPICGYREDACAKEGEIIRVLHHGRENPYIVRWESGKEMSEKGNGLIVVSGEGSRSLLRQNQKMERDLGRLREKLGSERFDSIIDDNSSCSDVIHGRIQYSRYLRDPMRSVDMSYTDWLETKVADLSKRHRELVDNVESTKEYPDAGYVAEPLLPSQQRAVNDSLTSIGGIRRQLLEDGK